MFPFPLTTKLPFWDQGKEKKRKDKPETLATLSREQDGLLAAGLTPDAFSARHCSARCHFGAKTTWRRRRQGRKKVEGGGGITPRAAAVRHSSCFSSTAHALTRRAVPSCGRPKLTAPSPAARTLFRNAPTTFFRPSILPQSPFNYFGFLFFVGPCICAGFIRKGESREDGK